MKIKSSRWRKEALDIHLLPGATSVQLVDRLEVSADDGKTYVFDSSAGTTHPDLSVEFVALFKGTRNDDHGVKVDSKTGVVSVDSNPPASVGAWNFLVAADFHVKGIKAEGFTRIFRVNVHDFVKELFLTPNPVTMRVNERLRFRVVASFEDGTMGDLFEHGSRSWKVAAPSTGVKADVTIDAEGVLAAKTKGRATVELEMVDSWWKTKTGGLVKASADLYVEQSWADLGKNTEVKPVRKGSKNGSDSTRGRHFLFLPEGWPSEEQARFETIAQELVQKLTSGIFEPFKMLREELSFWYAWIPSPPYSGASGNPGMNIRTEVLQTKLVAGGTTVPAFLQMNPKKPGTDGSKPLSSDEVFYAVGLPTAKCRGLSRASLNARWNTLYDVDVSRIRDAETIWYTGFDRRFLWASPDTAFRFNALQNTAAEPAKEEFTSPRINVDQLRSFLAELKIPGSPVREIWTKGPSAFHTIYLPATVGRQFQNAAKGLVLNLGQTPAVDASSPLPSAQANFSSLNTISDNLLSVFAHEMSHALTLGDEYGEKDLAPASEEENVKQFGNLIYVSAADAKKGYPNIGKWWTWHRIDAACVAEAFAVVFDFFSGVFTITATVTNGGEQFNKGEMVYLRTRPLSKARVEGPYEVVTSNFTSVTIQAANLVLDSYDPFKNGIIYRPVTLEGRELCLAADVIQKLIRDKKLPLNAITPKDQTEPVPGEPFSDYQNLGTQTLRLTLPELSQYPLLKNEIVGLYASGNGYYYNVYHPTGSCLMLGGQNIRSFCFVCQYILVDLLDPHRHRKLDLNFYATKYPIEAKVK